MQPGQGPGPLYLRLPMALLLGIVLWAVTPWGPLLLAAVLAPYVMANAIFSLALASDTGWKQLALLPWIFLILHLAYGTGFLAGLLSFVLLRRKS